jgi:hypothetical protein
VRKAKVTTFVAIAKADTVDWVCRAEATFQLCGEASSRSIRV